MRKLSINVSADMEKVLAEHHEKGGKSFTDTTRRALLLYDMIHNEVAKGTAIILRSEDGREREIVFLP